MRVVNSREMPKKRTDGGIGLVLFYWSLVGQSKKNAASWVAFDRTAYVPRVALGTGREVLGDLRGFVLSKRLSKDDKEPFYSCAGTRLAVGTCDGSRPDHGTAT